MYASNSVIILIDKTSEAFANSTARFTESFLSFLLLDIKIPIFISVTDNFAQYHSNFLATTILVEAGI
jgi:hypothetical protein